MATYEEQVFWREQLPSFYLQAGPPTEESQISYNDYGPIPLSSSPPSPLITLPVELLDKIFAFMLPDYGRYPIILSNHKHVINLVQICRYWRILALRNPTLWAAIGTTYDDPATLNRIRLWLARTGATCPLDLYLHSAILSTVMEDAITLFLPYVHRWNTINLGFQGGSKNILQKLADLPRGSAHQLKSICLQDFSVSPQHLAETLHEAWIRLSSTESLRAVLISNWTPGFISCVPWHQLTHLELESLSAQTTIDNLPRCPQLEYLNISHSFGESLPRCSSPVVLPSLRSLRLLQEMNSIPLLDCLTAPALLNLSIQCMDWPRTKPRPASLHGFLTRSQCSLRSFALSHLKISEGEYIQYIQSPMLRGVTSVILDDDCFSDAMCEALIVTRGSSPLFPAMERLRVIFSWSPRVGLVERMLLSRLQTGTLKRVQLVIRGSRISDYFVESMTKYFSIELVRENVMDLYIYD